MEALVIIFRNLDLGESPEFKYELDYTCRGSKIHIDADPQRPKKEQVQIRIDGEAFSYRRFWNGSDRIYLPSYVFGYYSGPGNRMEDLFKKHQDRFYDYLIDEVEDEDKDLRPLFYSRLVHSHFVLLAFFNEQDQAMLDFLEKYLRIKRLDSVLFVMKKPPWKSSKGDPRFWYARGEVQKFLSKLYELALAPLRIKQSINLGFREKKDLEHLYLYLKDIDSLKALSSLYSNQKDFFTALESTYISELILEVRIRVEIHNVVESLTYRDLSEGEQQLLMVLGLLRFTKADESLFLLDEPDTHLNPVWSIQYLEFLKQIVGNQEHSHIIMTTHNPLVIASLEQSQVKIMQRNDETGRVTADPPEDSPRGMGIDGILTSDLFGLSSALDPITQGLIDRRRELAVKEVLTEQDMHKLDDLNNQLEGLDFSISARDVLYTRFIKEMTRRQAPEKRRLVALTPKQQKEQTDLINEILDEIAQEEREA